MKGKNHERYEKEISNDQKILKKNSERKANGIFKEQLVVPMYNTPVVIL